MIPRVLLGALLAFACGCSGQGRVADAAPPASGSAALRNAKPAQTEPSPECGYPADRAQLERSQAGVPLVFRTTALSGRAVARLKAMRERAIAREGADLVRCRSTDAYFHRVLDKLIHGSQLDAFAASFPETTLLTQCRRGDALPGARAGPGHVLVVPRALAALATSEDAVAAVLAHELAHFTLRHAERLIGASEGHGYLSLDSRAIKSAHEREADITGLRIMVNAGYDPWAAVEHLERVDAIARSGVAVRPSCDGCRRTIHDARTVRVARLRAQIRACRYAVPKTRISVPAAVRAERIPGDT